MYSVDVSLRENLHKEIMKLHNKGRGYAKIHRYLRENGIEIGKSRITVYSMIKRIKNIKKLYLIMKKVDLYVFELKFVSID